MVFLLSYLNPWKIADSVDNKWKVEKIQLTVLFIQYYYKWSFSDISCSKTGIRSTGSWKVVHINKIVVFHAKEKRGVMLVDAYIFVYEHHLVNC